MNSSNPAQPSLPLNNQLATLNLPAQLPPVHPQCRIISMCRLSERVAKLRAAGDTVEADMIVRAVNRALVRRPFGNQLTAGNT